MTVRNTQANIADALIRMTGLSTTRPVADMDDREKGMLIRIAVEHGLAPRLSRLNLKEGPHPFLPEKHLEACRQEYLTTLLLNTRLLKDSTEISSCFTGAGIGHVFLKGTALLALLYVDPGLRPMSDTDILVEKNDFDVASSMLAKLGFTESLTSESEFASRLRIASGPDWKTFRRHDTMIDLHSGISTGKGSGTMSASILLHTVRHAEIDGIRLPVPSTEGMLLHLLVHIDKHFRKGVTRYSNMMDILLFLDRFAGQVQWKLLRENAKSADVEDIIDRWLELIKKRYLPQLPVEIRHLGGQKSFERYYRQWLTKGNRKSRPVVPPWKRKEYAQTAGRRERLKYALHVLFPRISYMRAYYGLSNNLLVILYYPLRIILHTTRWIIQRLKGNAGP